MMPEAIVVGAGPNGLVGAAVLAQHGLRVTVLEAAAEIGGGTRSAELTVPGLLHDVCSAVHPFGVASPVLTALHLERYGLDWVWPEVDLAHPLDDGRAAVLTRDIDRTATDLGVDGPAWRRLFAPLAKGFDELAADVLRPPLHRPRHPVHLARFGADAVQSAALIARRWRTDEARALFAGVAAHAFRPLTSPGSAATGLLLAAAGHRYGWPVARGGSQTIARAVEAKIDDLGVTVETNTQVSRLPRADVVLLDLAPGAAERLIGDRMPRLIARAYRRYRHGPSAFKLDLAVRGGIPWRNEAARKAGTVHVGGTFEEIADAEARVTNGALPRRPFVLVAQQYLADPARSAGDVHPVWAYAHVPRGCREDATDAILDQIERFAPGTRARIVTAARRTPEQLEQYDPNYVGGDISTGANDLRQLLFRPRIALDPYRTGVPGVFLCSAATPPGAGVHGMCGANAAHAALRAVGIPVASCSG